MKRFSFSILAGCCLSLLIGKPADAANPITTPTISQELRKVLNAEIQEESTAVDRRKTLSLPHPETASNQFWWQSGFVKVGNSWKVVEQSFNDGDSHVLEEYRQFREETPKTPEGQLKLAGWCESHKLKDQERAHLLQVLLLSDPAVDHTSIYQRLGYRLIGGQWLSPGEVQDLQIQSQQREEHLRKWLPAIERIVRNWEGNPKQQRQAKEELNKIDDTSSIPALLLASTMNESLGLAICKVLGKMEKFEASQAMASLAVLSDFPTVRSSATETLKDRRIDDFAPALLGAMKSPLSMVTGTPDTTEPRLYLREEADSYVAVDVQFIPSQEFVYGLRTGRLFPVQNSVPNNRQPTQLNAVSAVSIARLRTDSARLVDDANYQLQRRLEIEDDRSDEINLRASAVLSTASKMPPSTDPRYWWAWWSSYSGTKPMPKKIRIVKKIAMQGAPRIVRVIPSCLVAGTPIWTDRGLTAIEQIQAGDKVLAKDITSGEITYKPVVHTTVPEPVLVKKFVVAGSPIVASDGHHFWSSGSGWTKTRDIQENLPIHTVTGMSRVESIESQPKPEPVYNLVVADFHTYFVGAGMVLSHDVTPPAPTNVKVPGLVAEDK